MLSDRELLSRLVEIDSTSANSNLPIADVICDYLDRPGVTITRLPDDTGRKVNVVARMGSAADGGAGLTLSGHLDVVPAVEPEWTSEPFALTERDDAWYGRGTCDMKGFVALATNLFREIDPAQRSTPLCLIFTYDEELGTLGAQAFAKAWPDDDPLPVATIIGEPTSLRVVRMHKGHLTMRIETEGRAAHSGSPHLGVNAIEPAARIVAGLASLRAELEAERLPSSDYFHVPFPVLNVARIHAGNAVNVVPDACVIDVGLRLLPGQAFAPLVERVRGAVTAAAAGHPTSIAVMNESPALHLPDDAGIHRRLCGLVDQHESYGVNFASDAGPLQQLGLECVLFGPGDIEDAHRPDEYVPIAEMQRCREVLETLLRDP